MDLGYHEHPSKLNPSSSKNDTSQKKNLTQLVLFCKIIRQGTFQRLKIYFYIYIISHYSIPIYIYTHDFVLCAMFQSHQPQTKPSKKKKNTLSGCGPSGEILTRKAEGHSCMKPSCGWILSGQFLFTTFLFRRVKVTPKWW